MRKNAFVSRSEFAFFGALFVTVALAACARPPGEKNSRQDAGASEAPRLTGAQLSPSQERTFEQKRDEYVQRRLAELPHIDLRIRALELEESIERGRRQQDSEDLIPRVREARTKYENDLHRAESAGPDQFPALKKEIDDLEFELDAYLRKPSP
jgi:hypothetical protein